MMSFETQTQKVVDDPNVLAGRCPGTGISIQFGTNVALLFKPKQSMTVSTGISANF